MKTSRRRALKLCLLGVPATARAGALQDGSPIVDNFDLLPRVANLLKNHAFEELRPDVSNDGGALVSYYLSQMALLGRCSTVGGHRNLIFCKYIRSAPYKPGGANPARGHGFILCFTDILHLECYTVTDASLSDIALEGNVLEGNVLEGNVLEGNVLAVGSRTRLDLHSEKDFKFFREVRPLG